MARIKRVFSNSSECIHIWATRVLGYGRSSNVSFRSSKILTLLSSEDDSDIGDVLYSYNTPIAAFRESAKGLVVFLNDYSYSHTTSKHQSVIRSAVTQPIFEYDSIPKWVKPEVKHIGYPQCVKPESIWQQYHDIYVALLETACLRKFSRTSDDRKNLAFQYARKANLIKEYFGLDCPMLSFEITPELQAALDAANAKKLEKERLAFERSKQERLDWLAGLSVRYPNAHTNPIVLRVHPSEPNRVQTSRGAVVPLRVCKSLYEAFKAQSMPEDTRVGNFTLQGVYDWGIRIGCHNIQAKELERFAKVIGLSV
ncbi:hypothetical protein [Pseudanabaena phage PA-SR01]|nr:hypothetical protein [Pseudanabaena phage PA-SR01]